MAHDEQIAARNYLEGVACRSLLADVQTKTAPCAVGRQIASSRQWRR
jgi:hypothetical protein